MMLIVGKLPQRSLLAASCGQAQNLHCATHAQPVGV